VPEDFPGGPDPLDRCNAYAEGKRAAEFLCGLAASDPIEPVKVSIARCFAFVGPHLPLDVHFAIGNFIRDALAGGPIRVSGDGTPYRSYLYAADLAEWLITILLRGRPGRAYNVGSEQGLSIKHLAGYVATHAASFLGIVIPHVTIAMPSHASQRVERYVPSCFRARGELGLLPRVPLNEALMRTMEVTFTRSHKPPVDRPPPY
jgi:nucleoside-diphosphate-sugar epimerase